MKLTTRILRWLPALLLALVAAGCGDQGTPDRLLGPKAEASQSLSLKADLTKILKGQAPDLSVRETEKVIGPEGGFVYVDLHYLYVPRGAVSRPTLFRMELPEDGTIGTDLTATSLGSTVKNDVGSAGFKVPVYLTFSYAYATNPPANPARLRVFWMKPDGTMEAQPTAVNQRFKTATGTLKHFSIYAIGDPGE